MFLFVSNSITVIVMNFSYGVIFYDIEHFGMSQKTLNDLLKLLSITRYEHIN